MKKIISFVVLLFFFCESFASHISGGELFYEYVGPGAGNSSRYRITMRLFRDCHPSDPSSQLLENELVAIGIYDNSTLTLQTQLQLTLVTPIRKIEANTDAIPCLINAPEVCFQVGIFTGQIDLPRTPDGYMLSWVRCCRRNNIGNLGESGGVGATFLTKIPGTDVLPVGDNSSPQFLVKDTALVCQDKNFVLDFGAIDPDGDEVTYSFCDAYKGGTLIDPNPGAPGGAGVPPRLDLLKLPYKSPYEGSNPLGPSVKIDPRTGKITGIAPAAGGYVINVCATERRNGKIINVHRKDFILEVGDCTFAAAEPLPVTGAWCKDFKVEFSNRSTSAIQSFHWDFGVPGATSEEAAPVYTYPDTGIYTVKLTVRGSAGCIDEATTTVGVYPGFKPDFDVIGSCFKTPFTFKDKSSTGGNGTIDSWRWTFDNVSPGSDVSTQKDPTYTYGETGTKNVSLVVTSSKGCLDSITKPLEVRSVAALSLPFSDTVMCSKDTLPLNAIGTGTFTWSPAYNIINANTPTPSVFPKKKTTYTVSVVDPGGCVNSDSLTVDVVNNITVSANADTTICRTDTIFLTAAGTAPEYRWTPAAGLITDPNLQTVAAKPDAAIDYIVTANLGTCEAIDTVSVKVIPYPRANAGSDVTICYGNSTTLSGSITGTSFTWSPQNALENANTLTPLSRASSTIAYVLAVYDTLGCPKPGQDTVVVNVTPPVRAFAGNDTFIVANQPLQLNATGGIAYQWTPTTGLSNPLVANPVVTLGAAYDSVTYLVRVDGGGGCFADDEMKVKVFKTGPDLFIPTAFTPNSDGRNDVLRPLPVGISKFHYFRIYNRWGQMLFSTSAIGQGWNGIFAGKEQPAGAYVFTAEATDYLGKVILKKGTFVLIR